jgi:hypothetical protein
VPGIAGHELDYEPAVLLAVVVGVQEVTIRAVKLYEDVQVSILLISYILDDA